MIKRNLHISASSINNFKACPMRFRNANVLGIRREDETEAQRLGTHWHRILDIITRKPESVCNRCAKLPANDPNCSICAGTGFLPENLMDAVYRELDRIYENKTYLDPTIIAVEKNKLLYALIGYRWYYEDQPEEVVTREQRFELSLINPESGRALPGVRLVGMIDKIISLGDRFAVKEHKSTSSSVSPDSDYWGHLNLDTQTKLYLYAARRLQRDGLLAGWGIKETHPLINTILYDVFHKPSISPKLLTQAESKQFVEDGLYCGQKFEIRTLPCLDSMPGYPVLTINSITYMVEPGKKEGTFAIRETPEMYGARLLADIGERPEFYFRCVEVTRTDKGMESFEWELLNIYRTMQEMIKTGHWYGNEYQCQATFTCDYMPSCYNNIELSVDEIPDGFKLIFNKEEE